MAIRFGDQFAVDKKSRDAVYDFLTDPNRFAPLLPDYQSHIVNADGSVSVMVNVGVSYIRGIADVKLRLADSERPHRARYQGVGSMSGGSVNLLAGFDLVEVGAGTQVAWQGEAQVFGRLTSLAGGMLEPLARKQVTRLIDGLQKALNA